MIKNFTTVEYNYENIYIYSLKEEEEEMLV